VPNETPIFIFDVYFDSHTIFLDGDLKIIQTRQYRPWPVCWHPRVQQMD